MSSRKSKRRSVANFDFLRTAAAVALVSTCCFFFPVAAFGQLQLGSDDEEKQKQKQEQQLYEEGRMGLHAESETVVGLRNQLRTLKRIPSLQEQLGIADAQISKLESVVEDYRVAQRDLVPKQREIHKEMIAQVERVRGLDRTPALKKEIMEAVQALQDEQIVLMSHSSKQLVEGFREVLLPHQFKRLQQLGRQRVANFRSGQDGLGLTLAIAKKLGVEGEQLQQLIRATEAERDEFGVAVHELRKKSTSRIAAVLTPEQREEMEELFGDIYDADGEWRRETRRRTRERKANSNRRKQQRSAEEDGVLRK